MIPNRIKSRRYAVAETGGRLDARGRYEAKKDENARRAQERQPKPFWWLGQRDPITRYTLWLAIYTFLLFLGTIGSVLILWKTDHTLNDTLVANERPWIHLSIEPVGDLAYISKVGISFTVKVDLFNTGKTPAVFAAVQADLALLSTINPQARAARKRVCDFAHGESQHNVGYMVFPNDHVSFEIPIFVSEQESLLYFQRVVGENNSPHYSLRDMAVVACVTYRATFSPDDIHKTGVVAKLTQKTAKGISILGLTMEGGKVPKDQIMIDQFWSFLGDNAD
jgi:hypothetical protein